ncbi:hypothetical protein BCON_0126g00150 [Botryotinia convoluta]|uniref:Uncharacterized protein n=1 Tax=Botryotinia convoluta TaxID=54673 RepID=A0A4Z1I3I8_9HELO|nr:hypothetical protein BCON_0126g00150 [Botryotinia convoluta]
MASPSGKNVHFVGSICLPDTPTVYRTLNATFPTQLKRIPDGEPGNRGNFVLWQRSVFYKYPYLVRSLYFSLAKDPGPIPISPEKIQLMPWIMALKDSIVNRVLELADAIDPSVELGFHFCYGDLGHQHFTQPKNMSLLVDIANRVLTGTRRRRSVNWIHMPVPKDRIDRGYFEPLKNLEKNDTELYLGVLHQDDLEGTKLRIKSASEVVANFGIATECGLGRADARELESALEIAKKITEES